MARSCRGGSAAYRAAACLPLPCSASVAIARRNRQKSSRQAAQEEEKYEGKSSLRWLSPRGAWRLSRRWRQDVGNHRRHLALRRSRAVSCGCGAAGEIRRLAPCGHRHRRRRLLPVAGKRYRAPAAAAASSVISGACCAGQRAAASHCMPLRTAMLRAAHWRRAWRSGGGEGGKTYTASRSNNVMARGSGVMPRCLRGICLCCASCAADSIASGAALPRLRFRAITRRAWRRGASAVAAGAKSRTAFTGKRRHLFAPATPSIPFLPPLLFIIFYMLSIASFAPAFIFAARMHYGVLRGEDVASYGAAQYRGGGCRAAPARHHSDAQRAAQHQGVVGRGGRRKMSSAFCLNGGRTAGGGRRAERGQAVMAADTGGRQEGGK